MNPFYTIELQYSVMALSLSSPIGYIEQFTLTRSTINLKLMSNSEWAGSLLASALSKTCAYGSRKAGSYGTSGTLVETLYERALRICKDFPKVSVSLIEPIAPPISNVRVLVSVSTCTKCCCHHPTPKIIWVK